MAEPIRITQARHVKRSTVSGTTVPFSFITLIQWKDASANVWQLAIWSNGVARMEFIDVNSVTQVVAGTVGAPATTMVELTVVRSGIATGVEFVNGVVVAVQPGGGTGAVAGEFGV